MLLKPILSMAAALCLSGLVRAAETSDPSFTPAPAKISGPEWKVMDYGPFFSGTLEVAKGNIANKGIAVRLDPGEGGVARGHEFFLFETDTLRAAAGWAGPEFIDWKNIALDGSHEVHASIVGEKVFSNPDAPGWADPNGRFTDSRITGRDGLHYGPLPRDWAHWRGLYVQGDHIVLSYSVGGTDVLESPAAEGDPSSRAWSRTFQIGARSRPLLLQVAQGKFRAPTGKSDFAASEMVLISEAAPSATADAATTAMKPSVAIVLVGGSERLKWNQADSGQLRLEAGVGQEPLRFKLLFAPAGDADAQSRAERLAKASAPPADLTAWTQGGPPRWTQTSKTRVERVLDARQPFQVESISLPVPNAYRSWMRVSAFDFFKNSHRAAVCTWQGDVWTVDGLGDPLSAFTWKRIASGLFQPLGLKIVDDQIFVTCRDQITVLRDLNGDGETDFYENFNNDAQVTEHFHEFAMDLQTDAEGNFYYAKGGRHAKDALVPQHGTLLRVSKDGARTDIIASGFRAPNGVCVNGDGTFIVSDQEGHWTPENRINWVQPGGFYGYMMGYHEGRASEDFAQPVVWVHKSLDRSPAEQLWVRSEKWGVKPGSLISLSYGTGKILQVLYERVGSTIQGGVITLPITPMPTGIMRGRFHPQDGQLYTAGLFGWAGDKTKAGGFYRVRYTGKPLRLPVALHATGKGMVITFSTRLDPESAADAQNYAVSRWAYQRTANYGSEDYSLSHPGQRGRDPVTVSGVTLSPDKQSVLLAIPDMQPCPQMEIKFNIESEDGTKISQLIQNTIHVVGGDATF